MLVVGFACKLRCCKVALDFKSSCTSPMLTTGGAPPGPTCKVISQLEGGCKYCSTCEQPIELTTSTS